MPVRQQSIIDDLCFFVRANEVAHQRVDFLALALDAPDADTLGLMPEQEIGGPWYPILIAIALV